MRTLAMTTLAACLAALPAAAQQTHSTVVETTGAATIFAAPTHADFWVHLVTSAETFRGAMDTAEQFERRLREALAAKSITPNEIEVAGPAIETVKEPLVDISVKLRFNMGPYKSADTGARQFAGLCDNLKAVAAQVATSIDGPLLILADEDTILRTAVTKATENAYPAAEAIARELSSNVYAVAAVSVESVVWNAAPEVRAAQPALKQVSCTATVRVAYEVVPRN